MKIILIGGTMESKFALEHVAEEIKKQIPGAEVSTYTYGFAMQHQHKINGILKGNHLITHSSGACVIERGAQPAKAVFISPSQPVSRPKFLIRAAVKTAFHTWRIFTFKNRAKLLLVLASNCFELLAHPIRNLKPFIDGSVSNFDLRRVLPRHPIASSARIIISNRDEMFTPHENIFDDMKNHGVDVVHIDAMHDEIFIDTELVIKAALKS